MTIAALVNSGGSIRSGEKSERVKAAQLVLLAAGHQLIADGDFGRITRASVMQFQAAHDLDVDGVVGPRTARALDTVPVSGQPEPSLPSVKSVAPWLSVMRAITGTKEFNGSKDNPIILRWAQEIVDKYPDLMGTVGWYDHDSIPWCGLCVAYCVAEAGFKPPRLALGAVNWFRLWADGVQLSGPALGAIMVKTRAGGGHVTLYEGEDDNFYFCRGGNQSDMVNVARIRKTAGWLGFMWPVHAKLPENIGPVNTTFANAREASEA